MEGQGVEFAIDARGGVVAINAARKGMPQGTYRCPQCKQAVYKTEGSINRHQFRHWTDHRGTVSVDCGATRESIEHLVGKLFLHKLLELRRVRALDLQVQCGGVQDAGTPHSCSNRVKVEYRLPDYDEVAIEYVLPGGLKPDVALLWNGVPVFAIEVFVTHEVSYPKEVAYGDLSLPWLEISATTRNVDKDAPLVHRRDSQSVRATCEGCLGLAQQRQAAKQAEKDRLEAVRQEQNRRKAFDARKVMYARLDDRPVLPAWARAGHTYTCPVCAEPVIFSAAEGAFLHEHPTGCPNDTAKRVVAALKLRRLLLRTEPLRYTVRCSGSSVSGASWHRCTQTTEVAIEVPPHDHLLADRSGLRAVIEGTTVWQAVLTPEIPHESAPSMRVSADDLLADGFPERWRSPPGWWCVECRGRQGDHSMLDGTLGKYGGTSTDEEHVAQFQHNHRLAGVLLDEMGIDLRQLKGVAVAIAPCTAGCGNDVVRVSPKPGLSLPQQLQRLVTLVQAPGSYRHVLRPLCQRCGAVQYDSDCVIYLTTSTIRHFIAEDRRSAATSA